MTVLSRPRHPLVDDALSLAREWCAGHVIDGSPALVHAVKVALTLDRHLIHPELELIAAALLHDAPFFAPADVDLDATLSDRLGPAVTHTIRALQREHEALNNRATPSFTEADPRTIYAIAADKIVALSAILRRASRADDPAAYWKQRGAFIARVPYFRAFADHAAAHLPPRMAAELNDLVTQAEEATASTPNRAAELPRGVPRLVQYRGVSPW
jgi:hypothetical protein